MQTFVPVFVLFALGGLALAAAVGRRLADRGFPLPAGDRRIGCVDGLRGYLALAVMTAHAFQWMQLTRFAAPWGTVQINFINELGRGAVGLFFMTTGLVFYPQVLKGLRGSSWISVYISRIFRIVPLTVISVLIVTAIVAQRTSRPPDAAYFRNAAQWVIGWDEPPLLGYAGSDRINASVLWSLGFEWAFYILVLPVSAAMMDLARRFRLPTFVVPLALIGIAGAMRVASFAWGARLPLAVYLPLFAVGMLAFELRERPWVRALLSSRALALPAILSLLAGMIFFPDPYVFGMPLFGFFFVCVVCGNSLGDVLNGRGSLVLGECSFGIYLLHGIVLHTIFVDGAELCQRIPTSVLPVLIWVAAPIVALLTAATYLTIERPAIRAGKTLAKAVTGRRARLDSRELEVAP